ncbi:MAG: hypothetical protein ACFFB0_18385 [Promethearchaeota archaeon]
MIANDFDSNLQQYFFKYFSDIETVDWKNWLKVNSREEYQELALKLSGLKELENLYGKLQHEKTNSRDFSIQINSFIKNYEGNDPLVFCHTSGSTNSNIAGLKWFFFSKPLIQRLWAPGMRAIFESSGLTTNNSAIIFVPSRMSTDGLNQIAERRYISLYSSEFSQRIMLSLIKPKNYLFYEYKNSRNIEIISKILDMDNISIISAPALTVLNWADINKFKYGLQKSISSNSNKEELMSNTTFKLIKSKGLDAAAKAIQTRLSNKLSNSTLIFSITSLSKSKWSLLAKFMNWKKGKEKFTNLYVGSEIGPFASSLSYDIARSNLMHVFPLTIPVIEYKGKRNLITQTTDKRGNLLISRFDNAKPLLNIDTGDIISVQINDKIPLIKGEILRNNFQLKYPLKISKKVRKPSIYEIFAGDFFSFKEFELVDPKNLLRCLKSKCGLQNDSLLLIKSESENRTWKLILPANINTICKTKEDYLTQFFNCPHEKSFQQAIKENNIELELIDDSPIDFLASREKIVSKVRRGQIPKGILKKWPIYIVVPS